MEFSELSYAVTIVFREKIEKEKLKFMLQKSLVTKEYLCSTVFHIQFNPSMSHVHFNITDALVQKGTFNINKTLSQIAAQFSHL